MILDIEFQESDCEFEVEFEEAYEVSDGGYEKGYADGEQAEYDRFWDAFQQYGERTYYEQAFREKGWNEQSFKPKYSMHIEGGVTYMFANNGYEGDLAELCEKLGIEIDFSNASEFAHTFYRSNFTRIGVVDATNATRFYNVFCYAKKLKKIDRLIVTETVPLDSAFWGMDSLEDITIAGTIGQNVTLGQAPLLSKDSICSVFAALSDTAEGKTATFSKTAVNNAFETNAGSADGSASEEWQNIVASKPNWTIVLS